VIHDGADKLSRSCSAEEGIQIDMSYPPEDERVGFLAVLGASQEGDVEKTRNVVGPKI
jgi:hypothetical protein